MTAESTRQPLRIRLLGDFELSVGTARVPDAAFRLRKAKSLLKLLALAPDRRLHRARVGQLLWPDRDVDSVDNNLHQAVYVARKALEQAARGAGACLLLHEDTLSLESRALAIEVDVHAFQSAAVRAREQRSGDAYAAALELYGGELLPQDSSEPWTQAQRQALKELHVALLLELSELLDAAGQRAAALNAAQQAVLEHPLHEGAQRALMRRFVADGRRQQALEQYGQLRELLKQELEAKPDPETRKLYHEILTQAEEPGRVAETVVEAPARAPSRVPPDPSADASRRRSPPLPATARSNLPLPLTSFIGRERESDEVRGLLARERLVTLTGPGGSGKTRLALEIAAELMHELTHGALLVELAPVADPALVPQQVATALGIELRSERDPAAVVVEQIGQRSMLLVLDNCEHVVESCAQLVQTLLRACPQLKVLATSREPLRVLGEAAFRVPSLALPNLDAKLALAALAQSEAVRLFVERARSIAPRFSLDESNAAAIAQVCLRLDGMPLALELAAARTSALSPAQIAERLRDSFAVLGQGNRGALTRQQTLTATIDWSHDLLAAEERVLFRRLSLFAGSFSLDAAEQVCVGEALEREQIADLLARLVDKSLVLSDDGGERRYRLLETVKQYGAQRLDAAHERAAASARFIAFYLRVASENDPDIGCQPGFADRLEREHDNLRAALGLALHDDPRAALQLCANLCAFWMARGYFAEGTRWLDDALADASERDGLRARALLHRAGLAVRRGQGSLYCAPGHEACAILRELDEPRALADALLQTAMLHCMIGEMSECDRLLGESLELAEALADPSAIAAVRYGQAVIAYVHADYDGAAGLFRQAHELFASARASSVPIFPTHGFGLVIVDEQPGRPRCYYEESFFVFRRVTTAQAAAWALANLSVVLRSAGKLEAACAPLSAALQRFTELDDELGLAMALSLSGNLARSRADYARGRDQLERAIALRRKLRDRRGLGMSLASLALLESKDGQLERAQDCLERAQELFLRTEDMPGQTAVQMATASIELAAGDSARACVALEAGRELALRQGAPRVAGWLAITLAEAARERGDARAATAHLCDAREALRTSQDARAEARIAQLAGD